MATHRQRSIRGLIVAIGTVGAIGLAACGSDDEEATATGSEGGETIEVAHLTASLISPFEQTSLAESKEYAKTMNANVTNFDPDNDPQKQLQQCQDAIATQKYKAFLLKSVDGPAGVPCARQAVEAGIKVVALDTPIGPDETKVEPQIEGLAGSVVALPTTYGKALADMTVKACEGKNPCKVAYVFGPPSFSFIANARKEFKDQTGKRNNIRIVAENASEFSPDKATSITKQLLQKHTDLDVITTDDDASAMAIAATLADAKKTDRIALISGGGAEEAVDLIKKDEMFGTAVLAPRSMARRALEIAVPTARGETVEGKTSADASTLIEAGTYVTKENADDFTPEWKTGG